MVMLDEKQSLLEDMCTAGMSTDKAWRMVGLSSIACSWVMYAYVTSKGDPKSFSNVVSVLAKIARRKDEKITPKQSIKIAELVIEQRLTGKSFSQRLCGVIVGVPKTSYRRQEGRFKLIYSELDRIISDWEGQAVKIINKHLKGGPL